jgi:SAM-dependent methyltransferase
MRPIATMPKFVFEYGNVGKSPELDGRLDGPAFHRNHEAIWSAVASFVNSARGDVLELGSGTGQHVTEFAGRAPQLAWWPSDFNARHLDSIAAWRAHSRLANLRSPQRIDLTDADWTWQGDAGAGTELAAILCFNVLHISPWRVSQNLMAGAGRLLHAGGRLFVYGPFKRGGMHTAPSNAAFDASLRAENPDWGVRDLRDLDALAQAAGLSPAEISPMPANNLVLAFTRVLRHN